MRTTFYAAVTALAVIAASSPVAASSLFFSRSTLSNMTEAACLKNATINGPKIFAHFKSSAMDAAGSLDERQFPGVFVSVTCIAQGPNTVMVVMGAGEKPDATKAAVDHVRTLMVLGLGPLPAG